MNKTIGIDLSSDRLLNVASDLVDRHDYIGALKMLNKNAELNFNDEDAYMLYAEIFDDIGLHERCVNNWFRFMDCALGDDLVEAYEGLAVAYMNLGNEHFSAYYYNQLLMSSDEIDPEMRGEIMNSFLSRDENPLKFVYPPAIADCSDVMSEGVDKMRRGDYDAAIDEFEKVEEDNPSYLSARNYIAMCNIISDRCEQAEAECLAVLRKNPDSVQALTTLAAVRTEQKKSEESRELARRLLKLDVNGTDDIYKIATVCCENKMHEEAFNLFKKLEGEMRYDSSVLFFKAVSAFNCGRYEDCFEAFDRLITLKPEAVIAKYHYDAARSAAESGETKEMSYFYRMPQEEREASLKLLAACTKLTNAQSEKLFAEVDITDCVLWCFDETEGSGESELQLLASVCAVKAGLDNLLRATLLNAFLSDGLKVKILTLIGERNEDNTFGVVLCHLYKKVAFRALNLGRLKRKNFLRAYATLTAHFGIIDIANGEAFACAAEKLYKKLEEDGRLAAASNCDALCAAIYHLSGVSEPDVRRDKLASFFDADEKKISALLGDK